MIKTIISVDGMKVNYSKKGQGQRLIMVHGTSVDAEANFGHVVDKFTNDRQVILPNYGGSGGSTIPESTLTLDILVEQITAILKDAAQEPVDLVGDSLGAVVAATVAARYPSLIRKLVLVAGWADSSDPRHQIVFNSWAQFEEMGSEFGNRYIIPLAINPAFLTSFGLDSIKNFLQNETQPDTRRRIELGMQINIKEEIKNIQAPTLIICGKYDYVIPNYQTEHLRTLIPENNYVEIESGHAAFVEKPDEVVDLIKKFIQN